MCMNMNVHGCPCICPHSALYIYNMAQGSHLREKTVFYAKKRAGYANLKMPCVYCTQKTVTSHIKMRLGAVSDLVQDDMSELMHILLGQQLFSQNPCGAVQQSGVIGRLQVHANLRNTNSSA